jgi:hypothetical protein
VTDGACPERSMASTSNTLEVLKKGCIFVSM